MRYLIIASYAESLVKFRGTLIEKLVGEGVDVHVMAPGILSSKPTLDFMNSIGVPVHEISLQRTGLNPVADLIMFVELIRKIKAIDPDAVLAYTIKPVVFGLIAARLCGVAKRTALVTGLGYGFSDQVNPVLKFLVVILYFLALRGSNVVFQNRDDQELFVQRKICKPGVSRVVSGSGVDVEYYAQVPLPSRPSFLLIARLLVSKGVREYVDAAAMLRRAGLQSTFYLVGSIDEGPDAIDVEELDDWCASGVIDYVGGVDDVRPVIEKCSVYVLPSYREGLPRTNLEAMSMGRAVITSDAPGCRETVAHGKNGMLVPVADAEALAVAMEKLAKSPELVVEMGSISRELAEQRFSSERIDAEMLTILLN